MQYVTSKDQIELRLADRDTPDFSPEQKLVLAIINQAVRDLGSNSANKGYCATCFFTSPSKAWDLLFDSVGLDRSHFVQEYLQPRGLLTGETS